MELRPRFRVRTVLVLITALQLFVAFFGVSTLLRPSAARAVQSIPYLVNFQGRLTDNSGNVLSDGSYNVKFRIMSAATSGTNLWEGDRVMGVSDHRVTITDGLFNIQFGDTSQGDPALSPTLFNTQTNPNLYLEVELPTPATATCATNGCASFTEGAMTPRQPFASATYAFNSDTLDGLDSAAFGQIAATNTFTAANLFAPTASSIVALTVKATTAGGTNSLEVFDSGGTRQAFFDATGALTLSQAITAPTTTNTINSLVINAGALSNVTGYAQASGGFLQSGSGTFGTGTGAVSLNGDTTVAAGKNLILPSGAGTIQQTFTSAVAGNAQSLSFTNTNAGAGIIMQGINLATVNATAASSGTNVLNVINFPAGTALLGSDNTNGINFASAVGYTNFLKTPTAVLTSAGAFTGVVSIAVATITNVGSLTLTTTAATGIVANTVTTGIAVSDTGLTTGSGLTAGGANTTSGSGLIYSTASNTLSTGSALSVTTGAAAATVGYTGALINITPGRTHTAATAITDTGNFLNLARSTTNTNAGGSFTVTGALANLQSNCVQTAGTCADSANILNLNQQYASSIGTVLNVQGAGTGNLATLDTSNATANGVAIDVQSTSTSQFVLKLTSNNATTNVLYARADGHVGIGTITPATALDVSGTTNATAYSVGGTAGSSAACSGGQMLQNPTLVNGIITAGTCATPSGTGASTSLNNLITTSINQSLLSNADNTLDLGSATDVWNDVFASNIDAGTTTTTLTIGTAATTTAVTVGRSGLAVSLPGGLTTSGSSIAAGAGTISGAVLNATTKFQSNGADGVANTCGAGSALTGATFSGGIITAAGSCTTFQAAGSYIVQAPAGTANTITAASGAQALILKGTNGTATHLLDIYNTAASPVLTSYFDQNGALTTTQPLTAPNSTNTINGLVINTGALSAVTGYTQTSGAASISSANTSGNVLSVADTAFNTTGGNLANLTFTNANATATATAVSGLSITPTGTASGNNTLNSILFPNVTPVAGNAFNGLSFGTGYSDILRLTGGASIINGSGLINGAQMQSATIANSSLASSSVTINGTGISGGGAVSLGGTLNLATVYGATTNTAVQGSNTLICPSGTGNLTGTGNALTLGTSGGTCAALNTVTNPSFTTSVTSPSFTGTGAVSVTSGAGTALTLDSLTGNLILGANTTALQKAAAALSIDLATAATSTLTVTNSNATFVANLAVEGGVSIGTGQTYKVNGTQISSADLSNDASITKQGNTFNGVSQLVQTTGAGALPAISGANLTNLNPTNFVQGSAAVSLQSANATTLTLNSGTTGAINLGTQGSAKTIQIGQIAAAVTDTVNIANSAFAGSTSTVTIGSLLTTSTTTIQGGTSAANAIALTAGSGGGILATTTGAGVIELDSAAGTVVQSTTNNTQAFQIQNSGGVSILNVDTASGAAANLLANSGFEKNPMTNWTGLGTGTIARDTTQQYVGFASGKITAGATAGNGASQAVTLGLTTQYTLSFYARLDTASAPLTTLQAGYSSTGAAGGEVDCGLNASTVVSAGWTRYICTFTTPGTSSGAPYIYIEHNDTTSEVFYIDSVQLETGSFATPYGQGLLSLNATINSPVNFQANANSTTAFQITNAVGTNILDVDTLNNNLSNQATNASFETGLTGWAARTGCTLTQDPTTSYNGSSAGKCVTTATTNAGANLTGISPVMVNGTTYTLSLYAKASANMTTLELGVSNTGLPAGDTACLTAQSATSLGWKRFSCTFTAGAQSGTPYVYIRQTDAVARTIWFDAVTMETDANASTNYRDGRISLGNATISSPAVFQTNNNSSTAFQIQNAGGIQVFNVDTSSDTDLVTNSGFEVNSTGWSIMNGATNLVRDTSKTYVGIASGKVTTTATANSGMRYTFAAALPAVAATPYTISAYVETSAADAAFKLGYNNGADTTCATIVPAASTTVPSTVGWTRFTCSTPVNTAINSIFVTSGTTAVTLNVDGVRVELGAVATAFGNANITFNGVFTSPIAIRNPNDTTTAFQVQNSASVNLFTVDSLNKNIIIGAGFSTTDTILVGLNLDSSATFAETAGTCSATVNDGALYYNSAPSAATQAGSNAIRSCVNGAWEDVITTAGLGIMLFGVVPDSGNSPGDLASLTTAPGASISGPCKVSWVANAATSTVRIEPCVAYSGGRKVTVQQNTTFAVPTNAANGFSHICLNAAGALTTTASNATEAANLPALTPGAPLLCLADVKATAAATGIAAIYDTRTFTATTKEFVTTAAATPLGIAVIPSGTGVALPGGASVPVRGIVVAGSSAAAAGGAPNAIIATAGPAEAKVTASTAGLIVQTIGTAGYMTAIAPAATTPYIYLGYARNTFPLVACTATPNAANCNTSVFLNINLR